MAAHGIQLAPGARSGVLIPPEEVHTRPISVEGPDYLVRGDLFRPANPAKLRALVVICNATGVTASFYRSFSLWFAAQGVGVLTFDYRWSGRSFPSRWADGGDEALRACPPEVDLTGTWAREDLTWAISYLRQEAVAVLGPQADDLELTILGHSLGGHLSVLLDPSFALAPRGKGRMVTRLLGFGQANPHWRLHTHSSPDGVKDFWQQVMRRHLQGGIFRSSAAGLGVDYPAGPGWEWFEWFMHPLFSLVRPHNEKRMRTNLASIPLAILRFECDEIIPSDLMYESMADEYATAGPIYLLKIHPSRPSPAGVLPYGGHVHVFRPGTNGAGSHEPKEGSLRREDVYWPMILAYVLKGQIDTQVVDKAQLWSRTIDFAAARQKEVRARERARQEAEAAGEERPIFGVEDLQAPGRDDEELRARL